MKASKLVDTLSKLVGIARGTGSSVEAIEGALVAARERVSTAIAERDKAQAAYERALLDESPAALAKLLEAKGAATIERDRAEALTKALESRLVEARAAEERAARKAQHDAAMAKAEAIRGRGKEYAFHANALREIVRDLADAEVAVAIANRESGEEFGYIDTPHDATRGAPWTPEEIVSVDTILAWARDDMSVPLSAEQVEQVRQRTGRDAGPDRGMLGDFYVSKRPFKRTRYREAVSYGDGPSLFAGVRLPPLHPLNEPFVACEAHWDADIALRHLSVERQPDPVIERPIKERLEPVPAEPEGREPIALYPRREPESAHRAGSAAAIRAEHARQAS